ncbi:MAG: hypothetical protein AB1772_05035 [Candidatus Zixiibacteriota bacterium]
MTKPLLTVLILGLAALVSAPVMAAPLMELSETEFDFGYVPQNSEITHVFWVYNRGADTLKIEKVNPG